jgi:hypothetical protein
MILYLFAEKTVHMESCITDKPAAARQLGDKGIPDRIKVIGLDRSARKASITRGWDLRSQVRGPLNHGKEGTAPESADKPDSVPRGVAVIYLRRALPRT